MLAIAVVVCLVLNVEPVIAFIVCAPLIPIAVGIAITRHGLYEIDRVISRTLAYASVTGAVIAVYVVLVTTITRLVPSSSSVAVTVATLSAAAVFQPLLRRVRASVDRRFDRAHYDLAETVAVFGGSLEQTVDLDDVLTDLHSVLTRTLQPARLNVWLQPHGERTL
jgi:hypothetical protein